MMSDSLAPLLLGTMTASSSGAGLAVISLGLTLLLSSVRRYRQPSPAPVTEVIPGK